MRWIVIRADRKRGMVDVTVRSHEEAESIPLLKVTVPGVYTEAQIRDLAPLAEESVHLMVPGGETFPEVVVVEYREDPAGFREELRRQTARLSGGGH